MEEGIQVAVLQHCVTSITYWPFTFESGALQLVGPGLLSSGRLLPHVQTLLVLLLEQHGLHLVVLQSACVRGGDGD